MKGDKRDPYTRLEWDGTRMGVPYGAYCQCSKCFFVGRTTWTFDFYMIEDDFLCEKCMGNHVENVGAMYEFLSENGVFDGLGFSD